MGATPSSQYGSVPAHARARTKALMEERKTGDAAVSMLQCFMHKGDTAACHASSMCRTVRVQGRDDAGSEPIAQCVPERPLHELVVGLKSVCGKRSSRRVRHLVHFVSQQMGLKTVGLSSVAQCNQLLRRLERLHKAQEDTLEQVGAASVSSLLESDDKLAQAALLLATGASTGKVQRLIEKHTRRQFRTPRVTKTLLVAEAAGDERSMVAPAIPSYLSAMTRRQLQKVFDAAQLVTVTAGVHHALQTELAQKAIALGLRIPRHLARRQAVGQDGANNADLRNPLFNVPDATTAMFPSTRAWIQRLKNLEHGTYAQVAVADRNAPARSTLLTFTPSDAAATRVNVGFLREMSMTSAQHELAAMNMFRGANLFVPEVVVQEVAYTDPRTSSVGLLMEEIPFAVNGAAWAADQGPHGELALDRLVTTSVSGQTMLVLDAVMGVPHRHARNLLVHNSPHMPGGATVIPIGNEHAFTNAGVSDPRWYSNHVELSDETVINLRQVLAGGPLLDNALNYLPEAMRGIFRDRASMTTVWLDLGIRRLDLLESMLRGQFFSTKPSMLRGTNPDSDAWMKPPTAEELRTMATPTPFEMRQTVPIPSHAVVTARIRAHWFDLNTAAGKMNAAWRSAVARTIEFLNEQSSKAADAFRSAWEARRSGGAQEPRPQERQSGARESDSKHTGTAGKVGDDHDNEAPLLWERAKQACRAALHFVRRQWAALLTWFRTTTDKLPDGAQFIMGLLGKLCTSLDALHGRFQATFVSALRTLTLTKDNALWAFETAMTKIVLPLTSVLDAGLREAQRRFADVSVLTDYARAFHNLLITVADHIRNLQSAGRRHGSSATILLLSSLRHVPLMVPLALMLAVTGLKKARAIARATFFFFLLKQVDLASADELEILKAKISEKQQQLRRDG